MNLWRARARALCLYAVGYGSRPTSDPVYRAVVEQRVGSYYSSCGDLPPWMWFRLGVRLPFVNRDENGGWVTQVNINRVTAVEYGGGNRLARPTTTADRYECGDVIVMALTGGGTTHTCVVMDFDPGAGIIVTADYGQPGGALRRDKLERIGNWWGRTGKPIQSWLRLPDVLERARVEGGLQPYESATAWARRRNLPAPRPEPLDTYESLGPRVLALAGVLGLGVGVAAGFAASTWRD